MKLREIRGKIDAVDQQLLALLEERFALAGQVAQYKKEHSLPVKDAGREAELLRRLREQARPALADDILPLFAAIIEASVRYQERLL